MKCDLILLGKSFPNDLIFQEFLNKIIHDVTFTNIPFMFREVYMA